MDYAATQSPTREQSAPLPVSWQILVMIILLALEGVSNFFQAFDHPVALYWLATKVLFITGLLKAWKWVYVLFLVVAFHHAIVFLGINIMGTAMNLLLAGLAISARRYFFPRQILRARQTWASVGNNLHDRLNWKAMAPSFFRIPAGDQCPPLAIPANPVCCDWNR